MFTNRLKSGVKMKKHSVSIRMPIKLFETIHAAAVKDHRSVSQQIVIALERAISDKEEVKA